MFTGIIEHVGTVAAVRIAAGGMRLLVDAGPLVSEVKLGDSLSVNGVCLTVTEINGSVLAFDAVPETVARTTLGSLRAGARVNLERAAALGQRMGGHLVQGHVDGTGVIESISARGNGRLVRIRLGDRLMRYVAEKGSVAVDGISLTVAEVHRHGFGVWIIPHTWEHTNLRDRSARDAVNVEVDLIARYVERLAAAGPPAQGLSAEALAAAGFHE